MAQVGADDDRHAQQEGLAERVRRRARHRQPAASIYTNAAGGAHLRGLYADFLDEAATLLGAPALRDAAAAWREAAARWDAIVDAALPPGRRAARADRPHRGAVARGDDARRAARRRALGTAGPPRRGAGELPPLGELVMAMYEAERAALARLSERRG